MVYKEGMKVVLTVGCELHATHSYEGVSEEEKEDYTEILHENLGMTFEVSEDQYEEGYPVWVTSEDKSVEILVDDFGLKLL